MSAHAATIAPTTTQPRDPIEVDADMDDCMTVRPGPHPVGSPRERSRRRTVIPRPFLKWAGGKVELLPELLARVPVSFQRYFEPFVGSGALFFELRRLGRIDRAYLSDANIRLIDTYRAVRDDVEAVIAELQPLTNDHDLYYRVRSWRHDDLPPARRAARMIYLNRTCYNGLYRENQRGEFNVPFGRYRNPTICDAENLRAVAAALAGTELACHGFEAILTIARSDDFVYFDPPYDPISATSSFTQYHERRFGQAEQMRLAEVVRTLDRHGVLVMLSNSATTFIRTLYHGFLIEEVTASRRINSKPDRRGKIGELIIRNYGEPLARPVS